MVSITPFRICVSRRAVNDGRLRGAGQRIAMSSGRVRLAASRSLSADTRSATAAGARRASAGRRRSSTSLRSSRRTARRAPGWRRRRPCRRARRWRCTSRSPARVICKKRTRVVATPTRQWRHRRPGARPDLRARPRRYGPDAPARRGGRSIRRASSSSAGFPEDLVVDRHRRVGGQHDRTGRRAARRQGLVTRHAVDVVERASRLPAEPRRRRREPRRTCSQRR